MNAPLKRRVLKLEHASNPPIGIEELLARCDAGDFSVAASYVPGENAVLDFLHALDEELSGKNG